MNFFYIKPMSHLSIIFSLAAYHTPESESKFVNLTPKTQPNSKTIWGVNLRPTCVKTRIRKSHATVPFLSAHTDWISCLYFPLLHPSHILLPGHCSILSPASPLSSCLTSPLFLSLSSPLSSCITSTLFLSLSSPQYLYLTSPLFLSLASHLSSCLTRPLF